MKNNNIGDFFRKRLEDDLSNEDWANPDMDIDNKVLNIHRLHTVCRYVQYTCTRTRTYSY